VTAVERQSITLDLVNLDPLAPRELLLQAGAFAEHQFTRCRLTSPTAAASTGAASEWTEINAPHFQVRLEPAGAACLQIEMRRYAHQPSYARPWNSAQ
jgi:hypothetical protein